MYVCVCDTVSVSVQASQPKSKNFNRNFMPFLGVFYAILCLHFQDFMLLYAVTSSFPCLVAARECAVITKNSKYVQRNGA